MKLLKSDPRLWAILFTVWFLILNLLSHGDRFHPPELGLSFPHADKVAHFGYFFGGAGLLSAAIYLAKKPSWLHLTLIVTVTLSLIGILDEYHQSFFANRTGNDPADWLFDTLGALTGVLIFRKLHQHLLPPSASPSADLK